MVGGRHHLRQPERDVPLQRRRGDQGPDPERCLHVPTQPLEGDLRGRWEDSGILYLTNHPAYVLILRSLVQSVAEEGGFHFGEEKDGGKIFTDSRLPTSICPQWVSLPQPVFLWLAWFNKPLPLRLNMLTRNLVVSRSHGPHQQPAAGEDEEALQRGQVAEPPLAAGNATA